MNAAAILSLIAELYAQIQAQTKTIEELSAANDLLTDQLSARSGLATSKD